MTRVYLKELAHGRSGDKSDTSNVCVFSNNPEIYDYLKANLTVDKVKKHFGDIVKGDIIRYDVDSLYAFNFVMHKALGGGATLSLRMDTLGKSMGSAFMRMELDVPDELLERNKDE